jgi:hypothetical protein
MVWPLPYKPLDSSSLAQLLHPIFFFMVSDPGSDACPLCSSEEDQEAVIVSPALVT